MMLTGMNLFNIDDLTDETKEMASVSAGDTNDLREDRDLLWCGSAETVVLTLFTYFKSRQHWRDFFVSSIIGLYLWSIISKELK